jgi:hypothetical protein
MRGLRQPAVGMISLTWRWHWFFLGKGDRQKIGAVLNKGDAEAAVLPRHVRPSARPRGVPRVLRRLRRLLRRTAERAHRDGHYQAMGVA